MSTHKQFILHLALIDGIGPGIIQRIIQSKPHDLLWEDLYRFSQSDWIKWGISERSAAIIVAGLHTDVLEKEIASIEKHQVQWTTVLDPDYPAQLSHIHVPPSVLYWRGTMPTDMRKKIAIVGSRKADDYGKRVIKCLVPALVQHGIAIVSGGAFGIDSMAHQATLDVQGCTVAILGSGLLRPYPRENTKLFDRMSAQGGAVLSSFPMHTEPYPGNFPARNRIIAGLSDGVLLVQAARKSGARITAQYALEQGKDIFAIPGPLDHPLSEGCHALIQEGAKLITEASDMLEELGIMVETAPEDEQTSVQADSVQDRLMNACREPQSIDELAAALAISLPELQDMLFELQVAGRIEQDFTGLWRMVV